MQHVVEESLHPTRRPDEGWWWFLEPSKRERGLGCSAKRDGIERS